MDFDNFDFTPTDLNNLTQKIYCKEGDDSEGEAFKAWFEQLKSEGCGRIGPEFDSLKSIDTGKTTEGWEANPEYNRYEDIKCFDETRIALKDGLQPEYIHANYVNGFKRRFAYILTQGPMANTICDFWRMVWQESVRTVVMVTRLKERGVVKCARYFPMTSQVALQAGIFEISLKKMQKHNLCCASLFVVANKLTKETRPVAHVWYGSWPDQGVPEDADSLRHFLNMCKMINASVSKTYFCHELSQIPRGPHILFHCSAGVGRSAVLVALDTISESMTHKRHKDVLQLVTALRQERFHAIQTKIQFLFLYHYYLTLACHDRFMWLEKHDASSSTVKKTSP